jgi:hypothetical protein
MQKRLLTLAFSMGLGSLTIPVAHADFGFDDLQQIESTEQGELLQKARQAARNWHFGQAENLLEQARQKGYAPGEVRGVQQLIASNRQAYAEEQARKRAEEERQRQEEEARRLAAQRSNGASGAESEDLKYKCATLVGNHPAYFACIGNENYLKGMGTAGLKALYTLQGRCDYLAGVDTSGMSTVCSMGRDGCSALSPQSTVNACYQCGGSNLWLRVYATGTLLRCY